MAIPAKLAVAMQRLLVAKKEALGAAGRIGTLKEESIINQLLRFAETGQKPHPQYRDEALAIWQELLPQAKKLESGSRGFRLPVDKLGKDQGKADLANAFIGYPVTNRNSSTGQYLEAARSQGIPVNDEIVPSADTVAFVSVASEGTHNTQTLAQIDRIIDAGGTVVMDAPGTGKGQAQSSWNRGGEGWVQNALGPRSGRTYKGYSFWGNPPEVDAPLGLYNATPESYAEFREVAAVAFRQASTDTERASINNLMKHLKAVSIGEDTAQFTPVQEKMSLGLLNKLQGITPTPQAPASQVPIGPKITKSRPQPKDKAPKELTKAQRLARSKAQQSANAYTIISGGQVGIDQIGLEAAQKAGLQTGGTAPPGFVTSNNASDKIYLESFGLTEGAPDPSVFRLRTIKNAQDADGTVLFGNAQTPGSKLTLSAKAQKNKPAPLVNPKTAEEIVAWMKANGIRTLNVAGNRSAKDLKKSKFTQADVRKILDKTFQTLHAESSSLPRVNPGKPTQLPAYRGGKVGQESKIELRDEEGGAFNLVHKQDEALGLIEDLNDELDSLGYADAETLLQEIAESGVSRKEYLEGAPQGEILSELLDTYDHLKLMATSDAESGGLESVISNADYLNAVGQRADIEAKFRIHNEGTRKFDADAIEQMQGDLEKAKKIIFKSEMQQEALTAKGAGELSDLTEIPVRVDDDGKPYVPVAEKTQQKIPTMNQAYMDSLQEDIANLKARLRTKLKPAQYRKVAERIEELEGEWRSASAQQAKIYTEGTGAVSTFPDFRKQNLRDLKTKRTQTLRDIELLLGPKVKGVRKKKLTAKEEARVKDLTEYVSLLDDSIGEINKFRFNERPHGKRNRRGVKKIIPKRFANAGQEQADLKPAARTDEGTRRLVADKIQDTYDAIEDIKIQAQKQGGYTREQKKEVDQLKKYAGGLQEYLADDTLEIEKVRDAIDFLEKKKPNRTWTRKKINEQLKELNAKLARMEERSKAQQSGQSSMSRGQDRLSDKFNPKAYQDRVRAEAATENVVDENQVSVLLNPEQVEAVRRFNLVEEDVAAALGGTEDLGAAQFIGAQTGTTAQISPVEQVVSPSQTLPPRATLVETLGDPQSPGSMAESINAGPQAQAIYKNEYEKYLDDVVAKEEDAYELETYGMSDLGRMQDAGVVNEVEPGVNLVPNIVGPANNLGLDEFGNPRYVASMPQEQTTVVLPPLDSGNLTSTGTRVTKKMLPSLSDEAAQPSLTRALEELVRNKTPLPPAVMESLSAKAGIPEQAFRELYHHLPLYEAGGPKADAARNVVHNIVRKYPTILASIAGAVATQRALSGQDEFMPLGLGVPAYGTQQ